MLSEVVNDGPGKIPRAVASTPERPHGAVDTIVYFAEISDFATLRPHTDSRRERFRA